MSAETVINMIYSDSQIVVVTIGSFPNTAPWIGQTAFLVDSLGHTTAVLAQTNQPTSGVTLAPAPYTTQAPTPLPSKPANKLPLGWAYEGCYNDMYPTTRALSLKQPYDPNLTVQACVWSCYQLGYSISGLENSKQCFCGNDILNGGTLADWDYDCNRPCSGNRTEICGGNDKLSVYSNRTLATSNSASAQTPELTTSVVPTIAPSLTPANSRTPTPAATIAAVVIGAVAGVTIMVAVIFYLYRRMKRNRVQKSQTQTDVTPAWPLADRVRSWEEFTKDIDEYYTRCDESMSELGLKTAGSGYRPSLPELRERYEQLQREKQKITHTDSKSPDAYFASTAWYSPPQVPPARAPLDQPTSILKHPTRTRMTDKAQRVLHGENEQGRKGIPGTRNLGLAKKCVRFGVNQIREFGRSPFVSQGSHLSEP